MMLGVSPHLRAATYPNLPKKVTLMVMELTKRQLIHANRVRK